MKRIIIEFLAYEELIEIVNYYQSQKSGLGHEFIHEIENAFLLITQFPKSGSQVNQVRKIRVQRFPFNIIYSELPDHIVVLAIAHMSRHPDYWKDRLD